MLTTILVHVAAAAPASAQGLEDTGSVTSVVVEPDRGVIRVSTELTLTNTAQNEYRDDSIVYPYLFAITTPVPTGAIDLNATSGGAAGLPVTLSPVPDQDVVQLARIDLAANLYSGETAVVRVSYDLPNQAPRSTSDIRVNPAYISFPFIAIGDPDRLKLDIQVPDGFEVSTFGDEMVSAAAAGGTRWSAAPAASSDGEVLVFFSARNDSTLVRRDLDIGGRKIQLKGWPGDTEWMDFTAKTLEDALPVLERIVGRPWPVNGPLELFETASNELDGYAGLYKVFEDDIEVTEELNAHVLVHELSHAWFNRKLFDERWLNEGLAETTTVLVLNELSLPPEVRPAPDRQSNAATPLSVWGQVPYKGQRRAERELYGYASAQKVLTEIVDEVGADELTAVIHAADEDLMAYQASPDGTDTATAANDWKRMLDLFEETAGSEKAEPLFREWVATPSDLSSLDRRKTARTAYRAFVAEDEWAAPRLVRDHMERWRFDQADAAMSDARKVLAKRDELATLVESLDLEFDDALRPSYEKTVTSFDATNALLDAQMRAATRFESVTAEVAAPRSRMQRLGLWRNPIEPDLAVARQAFNDGDLDASSRTLDEVETRLAAAEDVGRGRATWAGASLGAFLLLLAGLILAMVLRGRRRRRRASAAAAQAAGVTAASAEQVSAERAEVQLVASNGDPIAAAVASRWPPPPPQLSPPSAGPSSPVAPPLPLPSLSASPPPPWFTGAGEPVEPQGPAPPAPPAPADAGSEPDAADQH